MAISICISHRHATWNFRGGGRHECHDTNGTMAMTIMTARQWYRGYGNINRHITQTSWHTCVTLKKPLLKQIFRQNQNPSDKRFSLSRRSYRHMVTMAESIFRLQYQLSSGILVCLYALCIPIVAGALIRSKDWCVSSVGGRALVGSNLWWKTCFLCLNNDRLGCRNSFERKSLWYNSTYEVKGI